jgi:hypothetical protein
MGANEDASIPEPESAVAVFLKIKIKPEQWLTQGNGILDVRISVRSTVGVKNRSSPMWTSVESRASGKPAVA